MKSSRVRLEEIADPANLREAFLRAARGKTQRPAVIAYREDLDKNLAALREALLVEQVSVGQFASFVIHEPKERRIHAPAFGERVLHHALLGPCEADFERWLIDDCYACRRGKGREAALRRAEVFARRFPWSLKLDVCKYFDSIPHERLIALLRRRFRDARIVRLWENIIGSYSTQPGVGLPIGALTSQHLANFYLAAADRRVKETLRIPGYVRYMDDLLLFGEREALRAAYADLAQWLPEALGLNWKHVCSLQPCARGVSFLGYRVFPVGTHLVRSSRRRFLKRWAWIERSRESGRMDDLEAQRRITAMTAFVKVAGAERLLPDLFGTRWVGAFQ